MSHLPDRAALAFNAITTTEQLSGRLFDGAATYVKLVKQSGALGTGDVTIAHGISGMTRLIVLHVGVEDASPQWMPVTLGTLSSGGSVFGLSASCNGTNVILHIGTAWAAGNALSNAWCILEYLK